MNLKKYSLFISIIVLGFSSAYLISAYFNNKFIQIQTDNAYSSKNTVRKRHATTEKAESKIIKYNIFDLENPKNSSSLITKDIDTISNKDTKSFSGKLVGILVGKNKKIAVLSINNKIEILNNTSKGKNRLLKVTNDYVEILYNHRKYRLAFQKSKNNGSTTIITDSSPEDSAEKYTITKKELKKNLGNINNLINHIFVSPYYKKGEFIGYRISRIRRHSILYKIGLRNGDIIVRINGEDLKSPEKMLTLFSEIENLSSATIDLIRRGKNKTIFVTVEE